MLGLWIVLGLLLLAVLFAVYMFNRLVSIRNRADNAWSQIDVQLRRRYDLIPNLVETVKGYADHERELFRSVTEARTRGMEASSVESQANAENQLTRGVRQLLAVAEQYPDLKSQANVLDLQAEIERIEGVIADRRELYNDQVFQHNARIAQVPALFLAPLFGWRPCEFFAATPAETVRPDTELRTT